MTTINERIDGTPAGATLRRILPIVAALLVAACQGAGHAPGPSSLETAPAAEAEASQRALEAEGARIWRMTCDTCHNLRLPEEYSAAQWDVIVTHMRTRADLTRSEAHAVRAFLRASVEGDRE